MRYTTVIDISQIKEVYRSINVRLVYLHLALRCGYHDDDRDKVNSSIRSLAADAGVTVSAARHALAQLLKNGLLEKRQDGLYVVKWCQEKTPSKRQSLPKGTDSELRRAMDDQDKYARLKQEAEKTLTADQARQWLQELEDGRRPIHCGIRLYNNESAKEWLRDIIQSKE